MLFRLSKIVQWVSGHLPTVFSVRGGEAPAGEGETQPGEGETPPSFQLLHMRGKGGNMASMGSADPVSIACIYTKCNAK